ncbi:MAG: glycoside hydrolase family 36 protein [Puniceicoccales bacterium]
MKNELNGLTVDRVEIANGGIELRLCPAQMADQRVERRKEIPDQPEYRKFKPMTHSPDSMVHIKLAEDPMTIPFSSGSTMQDSRTEKELRPVEEALPEGSVPGTLMTTLVNAERSLKVRQFLEPTAVEGTLRSWTTVTNEGAEPVTLENLSSFVLSGMTPFATGDGSGRLKVHRFRTWWSNEGRHECRSIEELQLIRSWQGFNPCSERFGQIGTMPVRQFFPFVAIEDTEAGVFWGAQLAWAGSWQMEVTRRADSLSISGGLADFEFGHWRKVLQSGESLTTPVAHLACVKGTLEDLTHKLVAVQESRLTNLPASEEELPVMFNEWCTNWGSPSHDKTLALARRLQGTGIKYIVIDDGWAKRPPEATMQSNGDWIVDAEKFPHGMKATCDELRKMGYVPGVWFEFEVCNPGSKAFEQTDHHVKRDGRPYRSGSRHFWDLNDPWVEAYLDEKLMDFLADNGIGYLKVDYNDHLGVGIDHPDSLGEGLRRHVEGIHRTFRRLREKVGDLVIENCSSGGHRLEPSMIGLTSMSSFSDAHECWNIPIIARQLHYLMPPRQSQIWAVLYPDDSTERFMYSLTATLYGRMCLSGPVHDLTDDQVETVKAATAFYKEAAPLIREGFTRFLGETPQNWPHPEGWSGIWRENASADCALVVVHTYDGLPDEALEIDLPADGTWKIESALWDGTTAEPTINGNRLTLPAGKPFRGFAFLLKRQ